ncbi:hypothetical protein [Mesorhizobium sp. M0800]|uniref:hypothetical protein n=1 Tax=Mesorhizobium sp. M0800 TaxID=2957000 RepID=UPI00333542FC
MILLIGSAPDVVRCAAWPKQAFGKIVAINNAWRVRPDWDFLVHAGDFPAERMPQGGPLQQARSSAPRITCRRKTALAASSMPAAPCR